MSEIKQENGNIIYQSDIRAKEGERGFVGLLFSHLQRMSFALNNTELASQTASIYYNSLFIISHIPDAKFREKMREKLKSRIKELSDLGKENDEAIITASIEIVGDVMDHIDTLVGLEKNAKIAIQIECESCYYKQKYEEKAEDLPEDTETLPPEEIPEVGD